MASVDVPLLTIKDYKNLPETGPRYQLIEGYLYMAPAPNRYHQDISRNLELIIGNYLATRPIGKMYHAPFDVYLDEHDVFQPDILFVSNARAGIFTEAGAEGAPDLVVEILSPKTSRLDRENKKKMYAQHGVTELWIIDPLKFRIDVFLLQKNSRNPSAVYGRDGRIETPLLPGLSIECAEVFAG
jgi:Uma2 family endonuclease